MAVLNTRMSSISLDAKKRKDQDSDKKILFFKKR